MTEEIAGKKDALKLAAAEIARLMSPVSILALYGLFILLGQALGFHAFAPIELVRRAGFEVSLDAGLTMWGATVLVWDVMFFVVLAKCVTVMKSPHFHGDRRVVVATGLMFVVMIVLQMVLNWGGGLHNVLMAALPEETTDAIGGIQLVHNIVAAGLLGVVIVTTAGLITGENEVPTPAGAADVVIAEGLRWQVTQLRGLMYVTSAMLVTHLVQLRMAWQIAPDVVLGAQVEAAETMAQSLVFGAGVLFSSFLALILGPAVLWQAARTKHLGQGVEDREAWLRSHGLTLPSDIVAKLAAVSAPAAVSLVLSRVGL